MNQDVMIWREAHFEAAHRLEGLPESHRCSSLHGHGYRVRVEVTGPLNAIGWVVDFGGPFKAALAAALGPLDHQVLNDVPGLANPTTENIALWIAQRMTVCEFGLGVRLTAVEVSETAHTGARVQCG